MFWILKQNNSLKTKQQTKEGWQVVSCLANQREKLVFGNFQWHACRKVSETEILIPQSLSKCCQRIYSNTIKLVRE